MNQDTFLPKTYDYKEIDRLIGYGLLRHDGFIVEHYDESNVQPIGDLEEGEYEGRASLDARVREIAECGLEEAQGRYPNNDFRYVSRLQRDGPCHYWFEVGLTEWGESALICSQNSWCCDAQGRFNEEATERFWLERIAALHIHAIEFNNGFEVRDSEKWIDEPWAHKIKAALGYYMKGIKPVRTGLPDYSLTTKLWYHHLVRSVAITKAPEKIDAWFAKGYCDSWRDEAWAQPLMKSLALTRRLVLADIDGEPDYKATVAYWLSADLRELLDCKNILLGWNEEWALPIQDKLMTILLKQNKVRIYA